MPDERNLTPQVPGEQPAKPAAEIAGAESTAAAPETAKPEDPAATAPEPTVKPQTTEPAVKQVATQAVTEQPAKPASGLPHKRDIDPTKIKTAVLTQQGYVLPALQD